MPAEKASALYGKRIELGTSGYNRIGLLAMKKKESIGDERQAVQGYIDAYLAGDHYAFERLFELYKDRVYSMALHFSHDPQLAEDLTQAVFLKLLERMDQFRGEAQFTTWLYRIVVNTYLDSRRRMEQGVALDELNLDYQLIASAKQDQDMIQAERALLVRKALLTLPVKYRVVLLLRHAGDLTYEQMAIVLKTSAGTVASRLSRAHVLLARKLPHLKKHVS